MRRYNYAAVFFVLLAAAVLVLPTPALAWPNGDEGMPLIATFTVSTPRYVEANITFTAEQPVVDDDTFESLSYDDDVHYTWDFGDTSSTEVVTHDGQPADGNTTTHSYRTCGVYIVTLTVNDGACFWDDAVVSSTVTIAVVPDPATKHTWHVNGNLTESGDGSSWEEAFVTINEALNVAAAGDEIRVAGSVSGTVYNETIQLIDYVSLLGGYLGEGDARDPGTYKTILDGTDKDDSVVYCGSGVSSATILDGFTIRNGTGRGDTSTTYGGGIYCASGASPTISHNMIEDNQAGRLGGGIYSAGSPIISDNTIRNNHTAWMGGGIKLYYGSPEISRNAICGNYTTSSQLSTNGGGGIHCESAAAIIVNNTITGNTAVGKGGGVYVYSPAALTIVNNTIAWNTASGSYGGGIHFSTGGGDLINNIIAYNSVGVYRASSNGLTLTNNDVYGNTSKQYSWLNEPPSPLPGTDISSPPLFVIEGSWQGSVWTEGEYRLLADSLCIDTGTNTGAPDTDKDGYDRPFDGDGDENAVTDMGAYEYGASEDTTPPVPGIALSPARVDSGNITVTYTGAYDSGIGLRKVELWYKKGVEGTWTDSTLTETGGSGPFSFTPTGDPGTYYFDLVAEDYADNRSAEPTTGEGDCSTVYGSGVGTCSVLSFLLPPSP